MENKKTQRLTEEQIDYNVLNALNLFNEELGESYIATQFNPFGEGFVLDEDFVIERYQNACTKKDIISPDFIAYGVKETKKAFETSVLNLTKCIEILDELLTEYTLDEILKKQFNKTRIYLVCRIQLLNILLSKLKTEKNTLKMYQDILALDYTLAKYFEESYYETFNAQVAINAYIDFAKSNEKTKQTSTEDKKLIAKAKAIIQQNIKNQEKNTALKQVKAPGAVATNTAEEKQSTTPETTNMKTIETKQAKAPTRTVLKPTENNFETNITPKTDNPLSKNEDKSL